MSLPLTAARRLALALGMAVLLVAPASAHAQGASAHAQGIVSPDGPNGFLRFPVVYPSRECGPCREPFPRTFSYQYDIGYNRPRHFRYVGPDCKTYWTSTVRGYPLGSQWLTP